MMAGSTERDAKEWVFKLFDDLWVRETTQEFGMCILMEKRSWFHVWLTTDQPFVWSHFLACKYCLPKKHFPVRIDI